MTPLIPVSEHGALDSKIVRLGRAGSEPDRIGRCTDTRRDLCTSLFDSAERSLPGRM